MIMEMTLAQYQASDGIPLFEQIYLIGNKKFPGCIELQIKWNNTKSIWMLLTKYFNRKSPYNSIVQSLESKSVVFIGNTEKSMDDLSVLKKTLTDLKDRNNINNIIIVCGKGDYSFEEDDLITIPDCVNAIHLNNLDVNDPRLFYLPMGRDFRSASLFDLVKPKIHSLKKYDVYCNFSVNTHPIRPSIYKLIKSCRNIKIQYDHMGEFLDYKMTRYDYFQKLSLSRFAICPRGNAIDTFRLWDCLYLGVIPIVLNEALFHRDLQDLPILFLKDISDFSRLNASYLKRKYSEFLDKKWNYHKLKIGYWLPYTNA